MNNNVIEKLTFSFNYVAVIRTRMKEILPLKYKNLSR
jgi:hypothetical protein